MNIYNIYITLVTLGSGAMMEKWSLTLRTRTLEPPFQLFRCVKSRLLECVLIDQASRRYTSEICYMALKQRWRKEKYKCNWNTNTNIHWNRGAERQRRKESDVCTMRKTLTMLHVLEISRWPCEDTGISSNWPIRLFFHGLGILWPPCNGGDLVHDELHRDLAEARSHL